MNKENRKAGKQSKVPEGRIGCVPCKVGDRVLYSECGIQEVNVMEISPSGERVKVAIGEDGAWPKWISAYQVVEILP